MPAYNSQKQFVGKILDGSKPHTIRRRRKNPTKVGDVLYLYTGSRTKSAFKFAEAVCTKIEPVIIYPFSSRFKIYDDTFKSYIEMTKDFIARLAKRDGFKSSNDFFEFFRKTYKQDVLDDFEIIWWNPKELKSFLTMLKPEGDIKGQTANFVIFDDLRV